MAGNFSGFVAPPMVAYILAWSGTNWNAVFYLNAGVYFLGSLCWLFIDPVTPLDDG